MALLGIGIIPNLGWRPVFWVSVLPLVIVVPIVAWLLPESLTYLAAAGRRAEADEVAARYGLPMPDVRALPTRERVPVAALFRSGQTRATLAFWFASFMGLLLVYGPNTWLPQIMRQSGFSLGPALSFLLVLNAGAIVGLLIIGAAADRFGTKPVAIVASDCAAVAVAGLWSGAPIALTYLFVALAGLGSTGTQALVSSMVTQYYEPRVRAGALGITLGVGRAGAMAGRSSVAGSSAHPLRSASTSSCSASPPSSGDCWSPPSPGSGVRVSRPAPTRRCRGASWPSTDMPALRAGRHGPMK